MNRTKFLQQRRLALLAYDDDSNHVLNYTFTGIGSISGPITLIKQGNASLTLSEPGGDNFSGGIMVNGGILILDNPNSAIAGGLTVASGAGCRSATTARCRRGA